MKKLQLYLIKEFFIIFFPIAGFLIILFALGEFFWRLHDFVIHKSSIQIVLYFLSLNIPLWFVQSLPITTMLSTLLTISNFVFTKELTVIKTLGINLKKFFISWLVLGLILSVCSLYINEKLATKLFSKAQKVLQHKIKKEPLPGDVLTNLIYAGKNNIFATVKSYNKKNFTMNEIMIEKLDPEYDLVLQIYAPEGIKIGSQWKLYNATVRYYKGSVLNKEVKHPEYIFPIEIDIENFQYNYSGMFLEQFSIKELKNIIKLCSYRGEVISRYVTEISFRYAFSFINFILVLLSIPLGQTTSSQYGKLVSFVYTIISVIIYWSSLLLFRNLGELEIILPELSVWIPNFIFFFIGIFLYFKKW